MGHKLCRCLHAVLGGLACSFKFVKYWGTCSVVPDFCDSMDGSPLGSVCPWDFPGRYIRVGCHFLLHGIFQNEGLNLHLFHWQGGSLPLSQWGKPPEDLGRHINKSYKTWIWKGHSSPSLPLTDCEEESPVPPWHKLLVFAKSWEWERQIICAGEGRLSVTFLNQAAHSLVLQLKFLPA